MTIFRVQHNKNYTCINNFIATDKRLSMKAKGIWLYAFSRPDDWEFHINDIINQSTDKEVSIRSGLKELEDYGYLHRSQGKDEKGKFSSYQWIFYETPQDFQKMFPLPQNPDAGNTDAGNHTLLSTELPNTELTKGMLCSSTPVGSKSEKIPFELTYRDYIGKEKTVRKEDLIFSATKCKKDWTILEIEEAWKVMTGYAKMSDPFQLMSGIISKLRIKEYNLQKTKEMEKSCQPTQNQINNQKYLKNFNDWSSKDYLKTQSDLASKHRSEKDTQMKEPVYLKSKDSTQSSPKSLNG